MNYIFILMTRRIIDNKLSNAGRQSNHVHNNQSHNLLGQAMKYLVVYFLIMAVGCSSRTEYIYYSADKEAPAVMAMVSKYCSSDNENAKGLVSDNWKDSQLKVTYCGTVGTDANMKIMVLIRADVGGWPGINFPLIAIVENGKIISAYYESSSDILDKSIYDYDNNQLHVYLLHRSGGMRQIDFLVVDRRISIAKNEMIKFR